MTLVTRYIGLCWTPVFEIHPYCRVVIVARQGSNKCRHLHFKHLSTSPIHRSIRSLTSIAAVDVTSKWSLGEKLMSAVKVADPCFLWWGFANFLRMEVHVAAVQEKPSSRCLYLLSEPYETIYVVFVRFARDFYGEVIRYTIYDTSSICEESLLCSKSSEKEEKEKEHLRSIGTEAASSAVFIWTLDEEVQTSSFVHL